MVLRRDDSVKLARRIGAEALAEPVVRLAIIAVFLLGAAVVWFTNQLLTERFTETTRNRAELRLALYSGNIVSELQRNSVVPLLLARDPALIAALNSEDFSASSQRLISFQSELAAASIVLLDAEGRTVAATDRNVLGASRREAPYFVDALRSRETVFTVYRQEAGGFGFSFSRVVLAQGRPLGVVVVSVDMMKFERVWATFWDAVAVLDNDGTVILATEPRWRGRALDEALAQRDAPSAISRAIMATADWGQTQPDAYLKGAAVMRTDARIPFRGWRIVAYSRYDSIRDRVNTFLALEIAAFALIMMGVFYVLSRRARRQTRALVRESAELRRLNARLQREIAERERAQKDLAVAEQTLAQSSKLALLGEMSASISHELNQPLAAMKTYLAGARLLLERRRPDEALSAFQRIDDLIDRMGAITRQFKSYARKGGEAAAPIDLRACVGEALSIMEPQLRPRRVRIHRSLPRKPVMVVADRLRIEQVLINLLRNALDATDGVAAPEITIRLELAGGANQGREARIEVLDNGTGITDLDKMFEPFWTTKKPGEGVGLGLAISAGIVKDLGGRLTARNREDGPGAALSMVLPTAQTEERTAERVDGSD
jgi:two-component system C4-dicarboxylate transport sensor histidine kinase DctB